MIRTERGAVSIFIVVFAAILMSIITIGFMGVMLQNQRQAIQDNLSQNAYDSAMTGVEDAKRGLVLCENPGALGATAQAACAAIANGTSTSCQVLQALGIANFTAGGENPIQTSQSGGAGGTVNLNQAYTCVTVSEQAKDYQTPLAESSPKLIPLKTSGGAPYTSIHIAWRAGNGVSSTVPPTTNPLYLYPFTYWNTQKYLPMLRVQLIQTGKNNFKLPDFDGTGSVNQAGSQTLFLRPVKQVGATTSSVSISVDGRRIGDTPIPVGCDVTATPYACQLDITGISSSSQDFLLVTPLYANANISVGLNSAGVTVPLSGIQAVVDSTGRANDVFRRVGARVDLIPSPVYPNAAISLGGDLCKDFMVTPAKYTAGACSL